MCIRDSSTVVPLDGLITDPRYGLGGSELLFDSPRQDEIIEQFLEECSLNGQIYALPFKMCIRDRRNIVYPDLTFFENKIKGIAAADK